MSKNLNPKDILNYKDIPYENSEEKKKEGYVSEIKLDQDYIITKKYFLKLLEEINNDILAKNNAKDECKFCINTKIGLMHDSPNVREDFNFNNELLSVLHYHNRIEIVVNGNIKLFEPYRRYKFCPYCGKEL